MNDWTPTTQQVRDKYRYDPEDDYRNPLHAGANAERAGRDFDRCLDQVRADAWDEGHHAGQHNEHEYRPGRVMTNPYRQETES